MTEPKHYYAVHIGKDPGVYVSWKKTQEKITGYPKAKYRKFKTLEAAKYFVIHGKEPKTTSRPSKKKRENSSGTISIRPNARIGYTATIDSDEDTDDDDQDSRTISIVTARSTTTSSSSSKSSKRSKSSVPKNKVVIRMPKRAKRISGSSAPQPLVVFTDGSSLDNGREGCRAGLGIYFGSSDPRNVSRRIKSKPTNNIAELKAIIEATELIKADKSIPKATEIKIYTDSEYSINAITIWSINWERNNWINTAGKPVKNKKLIQRARKLYRSRNIELIHTKSITKLNSHDPAPSDKSGIEYFVWYGNQQADKLAEAGANKPKSR